VNDFLEKFASVYGGYSCDVIEANGSVAHGNKLLESVRASY
jgi:hypothetical protein